MANKAEFDLIEKYFTSRNTRKDVLLGVGDDCALLKAPSKLLATTVDTLIEGVHFPLETTAEDIAYKSIAVSLSDLASMGAEPAWAMLALTLPQVNHDWLSEFSKSFNKTLNEYGVQLIGGDTTQGTLSITVQLTGFVNKDRAMRRDKASAGDLVYVTGSIGDAALGLQLISSADKTDKSIADYCLQRLHRPEPKIHFAQRASEFCSCAIDVSDGLLADLGHVLKASQCGAEINLDDVPLSNELKQYYDNREIDWKMLLGGGDDYELCMVVSEDKAEAFEQLAIEMNTRLSCIGRINSNKQLSIVDNSGQRYTFETTGYEHFG